MATSRCSLDPVRGNVIRAKVRESCPVVAAYGLRPGRADLLAGARSPDPTISRCRSTGQIAAAGALISCGWEPLRFPRRDRVPSTCRCSGVSGAVTVLNGCASGGRDVSVGEVAAILPDAVAVARQRLVILRAHPEAEDSDRLLRVLEPGGELERHERVPECLISREQPAIESSSVIVTKSIRGAWRSHRSATGRGAESGPSPANGVKRSYPTGLSIKECSIARPVRQLGDESGQVPVRRREPRGRSAWGPAPCPRNGPQESDPVESSGTSSRRRCRRAPFAVGMIEWASR